MYRDRLKSMRWRLTRYQAGALGGAIGIMIGASTLATYGLNDRRPVTVGYGVAPIGAKTPCIYARQTISILAKVEQDIGRRFDCSIVYNNAAPTWAGWDRPWFTVADTDHDWGAWVRAKPGRRLVIGQSLVPTEAPDDWAKRGANGEYDAYIRELGQKYVAAGLANSIIRLGHEANNPGHKDSLGPTEADQKAWRDYWAHFAEVIKSVPGSSFQLDWTVNAWYRDIPLDRYYPGDEAVDVIGVDFYDNLAFRHEAFGEGQDRWQTQFDSPSGPGQVLDFARRHRKPLSVPEWGLLKQDAGGAGDNATYVENMAALVRDNNVAYQAYWVNDQTDVLPLTSAVPRSLAAYRAHFLPGGDAAGPG